MAYDARKKTEVRRSYVVDRQNLKAACQFNDVAYDTGRRWKRHARANGDDWDHARRAVQLTEGGTGAMTRVILDEFVPLLESTIKALKNSDKVDPLKQAEALCRLADAYAKTIKAAGAVDPELARLSIALETIKEQADFVRSKFPKYQAMFAEIIEPFGVHLSEKYG